MRETWVWERSNFDSANPELRVPSSEMWRVALMQVFILASIRFTSRARGSLAIVWSGVCDGRIRALEIS